VTNLARILLLFAATLPLAADPAGDLRAVLGRFTGRDSIRATYEVQRSVVNEGRFKNEKFTGKATVELESDANGFRVAFQRPLLDQVAREKLAKARDPKKLTPTVSVMHAIDPAEAASALDFAPVLLTMLEGAKLTGDANGTWAQKPARVLTFRLADVPHDGPGKVTVAENRLVLWLGPDLVPLAAERTISTKFSILVVKGESHQKDSWHFARSGDRLVGVRHEETNGGSGLGQKANDAMVTTVRVH
jgi:hypothetical protein